MDDKLPSTSGAGSAEGAPGPKPQQFEVGSEAPAVEKSPQPGSSAPDPAAAGQTTQASKLTADQVAAAIAAAPGPSGPPGSTPPPSTASDVDVIEPEWVDKAEHEIASHQGDPYGEEEAIETLQEDYLQKRYGFNVSNPNDDSSKPEGT